MRAGAFAVVLTFFGFLAMAEDVDAVILNLNLDVRANSFVQITPGGAMDPPPINDFRYHFTVTFDTATATPDSSAGFVLISSNLPPFSFASPIVYTYNMANDRLSVGRFNATTMTTGVGFVDFQININDVSTAAPTFSFVRYQWGDGGTRVFRTFSGSIPEPGHISLMALAGVAGLVGLRRRRARRAAEGG